jgi:methylphosphotriester-DNA--protein-cysteine methyltransferase
MKKLMKMMSKRFLIIVLACLIAGAVFAAGRDTVVYITKTGEKYHIERCSSVRNSKIAITLGEALSKGYEPCKLCNPPVLDEEE